MCKMRLLIATFCVLLSSYQAIACNSALSQYERDCRIQDRFNKVRAKLSARKININQIAEYKALRFIDRASWERAKFYKTAPLNIYNPAPDTWRIWEKGIDFLFKSQTMKINSEKLSEINRVLLTDGITNVKDKKTDQSKKPGEYRKLMDNSVVFCIASNISKSEELITNSDNLMKRFQENWEQKSGISLADVQRKISPDFPREILGMRSYMLVTQYPCGADGFGAFISFSPAHFVPIQISLIVAFIESNLKAFKENRSVISPIEFATVVQKWLVSVHPFADGNGRTSRAVQDMIMAYFGLPFVPAGDLQNDAMEDVYTYIDNTYQKIESMLETLEKCANTGGNSNKSWECRTVQELNKTAK